MWTLQRLLLQIGCYYTSDLMDLPFQYKGKEFSAISTVEAHRFNVYGDVLPSKNRSGLIKMRITVLFLKLRTLWSRHLRKPFMAHICNAFTFMELIPSNAQL
jgi:hypothetical protein